MNEEVNFLSNANHIANDEKHIQDATQNTELMTLALQLLEEGDNLKRDDDGARRMHNFEKMVLSSTMKINRPAKCRSFRRIHLRNKVSGRLDRWKETRKLFGDSTVCIKTIADYIEQYPLWNPIPLFKLGHAGLLKLYFKKYSLSMLEEYQMVVTLAMDMDDELEAEKLISYYIRRHGLYHLGAQNALLDLGLYGSMRTLIKYGKPDETVLKKFKVHEEIMCAA